MRVRVRVLNMHQTLLTRGNTDVFVFKPKNVQGEKHYSLNNIEWHVK